MDNPFGERFGVREEAIVCVRLRSGSEQGGEFGYVLEQSFACTFLILSSWAVLR